MPSGQAFLVHCPWTTTGYAATDSAKELIKSTYCLFYWATRLFGLIMFCVFFSLSPCVPARAQKCCLCQRLLGGATRKFCNGNTYLIQERTVFLSVVLSHPLSLFNYDFRLPQFHLNRGNLCRPWSCDLEQEQAFLCAQSGGRQSLWGSCSLRPNCREALTTPEAAKGRGQSNHEDSLYGKRKGGK